jgi:hypothetical protein
MRRVVHASFAICLAALCGSPAPAGSIGLSWDPVAGATGYRVYFGPSPGNYNPSPLYQGPSTSTVITSNSLTGCTTWHFAVTAYNAAGESGYSEPVGSWPRPEIDNASPSSAMQGSVLALTVTGKSFDPGAVLEIDNPDVVLSNPLVTCNGSCSCQYQVLATVEPMASNVQAAEIGDFTLHVRNPNGLADASETFEILVNPERFDINTTVASTIERLDGLDTAWLAKAFGTQSGNAIFDPDYDFDGNGWVDGVDLSYLGSNFGECWSGSTWNTSSCD